MHIYKYACYVTMVIIIEILTRHRVHCSPTLPPPLFQLEAMSRVVAPATAGLLALCITFIKPTLPYVVHTQMRTWIYAREKPHETFDDFTYTNTAPRKRQLLHTQTKQRPVATHTYIHLFNVRSHIISCVFAYKL